MRLAVSAVSAVCLLVVTAGLTGCLTGQDPQQPGDGTQSPSDQPPYDPPDVPTQVTGLEHLAHLSNEDAKDAEVRAGTAYVGAASGFFTVDVTDPRAPETLATVREASSRYVSLLDVGDRRIAAASGLQQEELYVLDVTDPAQPELLSTFDPGRTVHGTNAVPGHDLLYNPRGVGDAVEPGIDVIDVSDPANPEVVNRWRFPRTAGAQPVQTPGCAMIAMQPGSEIAYCPAVSQTYVLDISQPREPELVAAISNPAINVHHWVAAFANGTRIFLADWAGAGNAQTCSREPTGAAGASAPAGSTWVYDVSDPASPAPQGYTSAPPPPDLQEGQACVVHTLDRVPGRPVAAAAWHYGGLVLVDATDPTAPRVVDRWANGTDVWAAETWGPYVIASQQNVGLDVFRLTGPTPGEG